MVQIPLNGFAQTGFKGFHWLPTQVVFDFSSVPTLDLMVSLEENIGHRIGLDAVASATCGIKKTASGIESIQWWRDGKHQQVAEYCCYDVKITKLVYEYGAANKQLFYTNKFGAKLSVAANW